MTNSTSSAALSRAGRQPMTCTSTTRRATGGSGSPPCRRRAARWRLQCSVARSTQSVASAGGPEHPRARGLRSCRQPVDGARLCTNCARPLGGGHDRRTPLRSGRPHRRQRPFQVRLSRFPTNPRRRLIGSIRRECLDHVVVVGEQHLHHILLSYMEYYNAVRTHLSLGKDAPVRRIIQRAGRIQARPVLGGLHHQYVRI